ncbi:hypothetical protein Tco_1352092 [Tanacetum coccineum]
MLKICPKLPGQMFEEPPLEEEILSFIRDLGHTDYFMVKDQAIPRRNKMFWHYARDEFMFTTIRVISKHQDTQVYNAILPQHLTNQAMLESEAYMTYHAYATSVKTPKPKSIKNKADSESSPKTKLTQASKGKRIKTIAKGDKPAKKKQSAIKSKGLTVLSEVSLTKAEQIKLATKRSLIQTHSSHASDSGADEGTGSIPGVPDVPTYEFDDDQISWKSNDDDNDDDGNNDDDDDDADNQDVENQNDDDEQIDLDNDGDDFVYPKFSTHDEEDKEEDSFDPRVQTPSHVESTDDEDSDEEIQDANVKGDKMNEEEKNEEAEVDALYTDVNVNLEGKGQQKSSSVSSGFVSNMLNPSPDIGIDSLFNLNTELTSLIDVPVTTFVEPPMLSAITLPPPPTPLITHLQQTPVPTTPTIPSSSLQDLPNFGSLFGFDHRLKTLENNFSIPGIVDAYLANKMHEAVRTAVQLQSERLRDEAQAENADFLNKLDDNIKKIIKDQVKEQVKAQVSKILPKIEKTVNEQLEAKVLTRSSNESKTSHDVIPTKLRSPDHDWNKTLPNAHGLVQPWLSSLAQKEDLRESFNELMDTPLDFSTFVMNRLKVDTLTPKLLTSPTFELMKGSCKKEVYKATTNQLDWNNPEDVYSKHRIIAVIKLEIVNWHNYKHLDWITVRRDDDKLYKFKEGNFNRLHIQDIEDMLLLFV